MIATDSNKMTARYLALAFDGDGTLTFNKKLSHETAQALDRLLACNRKLILVSGQTVAQVTKFPGLERFELVVAENGAVLYWPASRKQKVLASSPPPALAEACASSESTRLRRARSLSLPASRTTKSCDGSLKS